MRQKKCNKSKKDCKYGQFTQANQEHIAKLETLNRELSSAVDIGYYVGRDQPSQTLETLGDPWDPWASMRSNSGPGGCEGRMAGHEGQE